MNPFKKASFFILIVSCASCFLAAATETFLDNNVPDDGAVNKKTLSFCNPKDPVTGALKHQMLCHLKEIFNISTFVETGTYLGSTVDAAKHLFSEVHTIELSDHLFYSASERFLWSENVFVYNGDSAAVLSELLPTIHDNILFYLDAHYSGWPSTYLEIYNPILKELEVINKTKKNDSIILINNLRLYQDTLYPEKTKNSCIEGYPSLKTLLESLLKINPTYQICFLGDAILAYPANADVSISPVLRACTIHRLSSAFPGISESSINETMDTIARAAGAEHTELLSYYKMFSTFELGFGYPSFSTLWHGLILAHKGNNKQAKEIIQLAKENSLPGWAIDLAFLKVTNQLENPHDQPSVETFPFPLFEVYSTYQDQELFFLWNSLSDIKNPNLEDFLKLEAYLKDGRRPYLDYIFRQGIKQGWTVSQTTLLEDLDRTTLYANRILQRLMFVSGNHELPRQDLITFGGASIDDRSRCIIMYSSFNNDATYGKDLYQEKMYTIVRNLEEQGFKGHALIRSGGYPMVEKGGLRLSHVPYSFKILSIIEASHMGYKDILWIDTSMQPTNDLSDLFSQIDQNGIYLVSNGINFDYDYDYGIIPDDTLAQCGLKALDLKKIPHIVAAIIGISFKNDLQHDFLKEWYQLTAATWPAMSFYPEEFLISIAAARTEKHAAAHYSEVMDLRSLVPIKPKKSHKPFWNNKS